MADLKAPFTAEELERMAAAWQQASSVLAAECTKFVQAFTASLDRVAARHAELAETIRKASRG